MSAEDYVPENEIIVGARTAAVELGAGPVSPDTEVALCTLATIVGAHTALEVGTDAGVSSLWFLDGVSADGALTSVNSETEFHQQARRIFAAAEVLTRRTRLIAGHVLDVLSWVVARGYDMMALDVDITETPECLNHTVHISHPGGVIAFAHVLWHDQVADPARCDGETVVYHEVIHFFADSLDFIPVTLPVGDGLIVTVKR